jgi:nucleotide-binding universal stress UspA family protein
MRGHVHRSQLHGCAGHRIPRQATTRCRWEAMMSENLFGRILVPTDLSDFSDLALDYALQFRKSLGSQITLLYAQDVMYFLADDYPVYYQNAAQLKKETEKQLHDYVKQHVPPTVPVATIIVDDSPSRAIIMTADNIGADLIIMGTHGRRGFRRAILGSVAERVLRETQRPVMTVIPKASSPNAAVSIRTILCPVNFTPVARQALEHACGLTEAFDAQLIVVNVIEKGEIAVSSVESQFSPWVDPVVRRQTRYEQVLLASDAAERVLEVADKARADLIVVGAQHKLFSDATVIGTTTERITRFARQPVLTVVRPAAVQEKKNEQVATVA